MPITLSQLKKIMPHAGSMRARLFIDPLNETMGRFHIDTPARQAAFLAQICHESGSLHYVREIASGEAYTHRADLGNTDPVAVAIAKSHGQNTGPFYKGRGLIQLTGYYNYLACGEALGVDLAHQPEWLETAHYASLSAGWFWDKKNLNSYADKNQFKTITRRINGGLNGYNDRVENWNRAQNVLGAMVSAGLSRLSNNATD